MESPSIIDKILILCFHIQVSQDASTTASLIKDTAADLLDIIPNIDEINLFSDNAGCYKSTLMMATLKQDLGNKVKSYNFSESQDGKDIIYAYGIKQISTNY